MAKETEEAWHIEWHIEFQLPADQSGCISMLTRSKAMRLKDCPHPFFNFEIFETWKQRFGTSVCRETHS